MSTEVYRVLVDLDALMDTRLAVLASIDRDIANEIGLNPLYIERTSDQFSKLHSGICDVTYRDRYLKRTADIVPDMMMTDLVFIIAHGFLRMSEAIHRGISPAKNELVINTHPYKLTDTVIQYLITGVQAHLPEYVTVRQVDHSPWSLHSKAMTDTYNEWYTYDLEGWMGIQQADIVKRPLGKFPILSPRISTSGQDMVSEKFDIDPWYARELVLAECFQAHFIAPVFFSYNHGFVEHVAKNHSRS